MDATSDDRGASETQCMPRVPGWLKQWLLPIWNGGHRLAWRAGEYVDALWHGRFAWCSVCGRFGPILYRRWVIPTRLEELWGLAPTVAEALARKESSNCAWCGAKLRARRMAQVILRVFPVGSPPAPARSVAAWIKVPEVRSLRVAEINEIEGLHTVIQRLRHVFSSDYRADAQPGSTVDAVRCEDLTRLTYPDESFDLVLTSESLEHVPDLDAALREIRRVLAPGGWHIFTVPLLPGVPKTFARAIVHADGRREDLATPISHPGGDWGYPVFTEFGADLPQILRAAGFAVWSHFGPVTERDLGQVFACQKADTAQNGGAHSSLQARSASE